MNRKEMTCYNTDASRLVGKTEKVVFPKTAEEVAQVVKSANKDIVPRGAGTSLVGGCIPNDSIVVDMSKMNKVSKFNTAKKTVLVEAGVTLKELNEKLSRVGFEFPIESFNQGISSIGGMVALNAPGFRSMKYGRIRDWIEEIEFVNGRGELMHVGKSDLMDVCGMEGITGVITSAVLRITPKIQRSASIFQAEDLDEIFSIARRLKLEKEVVMLEFFPPEVSKLLGLPGKYHLIIEFDSLRGKIKGEEYNVISKFKSRVYEILYSEGYCISEDPKFFFDKLNEFVLFLESNQIPYFGYLDIGVIHPFFKENEKQKRQEVIEFIKKARARPNRYGIGLNRKDLVDVFERKVIQRVKLRHDPFGKLNRGKVIDIDPSAKRFPTEEAHHLKPVKKEEIEEIKPLIGEEKVASAIVEELKTPNEKMEEFIEKVELMDKIADNEKPARQDSELMVVQEKEDKLRLDSEIKERINDYKQTFESEEAKEKRKKVEDFALNVGRERPIQSVETVKKQRQENTDYRSIQDIMTNKRGKNLSSEKEVGEVKIKDNLDRVPAENKNVDDAGERDMINKIMGNSFGFSNGEKKDEEKKEKSK